MRGWVRCFGRTLMGPATTALFLRLGQARRLGVRRRMACRRLSGQASNLYEHRLTLSSGLHMLQLIHGTMQESVDVRFIAEHA